MTLNALKNKLLLLCIISLLAFVSEAQSLFIGTTQGFSNHNEELLHRSIYSGYTFGLYANFQQQINENENALLVDFSANAMIAGKNDIGNDMLHIQWNAGVGYLRRTNDGLWKTGAIVRFRHDYARYSLNYGYPFWFTQYTLNWHNRFRLVMGPSTNLCIDVSMPIFGLFSRTEEVPLYEYKEDYKRAYMHKDMKLASWKNFQAISGHFYLDNLKVKWPIQVGYTISYFRFSQPRPIQNIYHSLSLSYKFTR